MRTGDAGGRVARAAVFAGTSVALGAAAHTAAGGMTPPVPVLVGALLVFARVGYGLTARERRLGPVLLAVGAAQIVLHIALSVATPMHHHGSAMPPALMGGAAMTASHVAAALVVALLLRRSDAALRAASALLAVRRLLRPLRPVPAVRLVEAFRPLVGIGLVRRPYAPVLGRACTRRGPPAGAYRPLPAH